MKRNQIHTLVAGYQWYLSINCLVIPLIMSTPACSIKASQKAKACDHLFHQDYILLKIYRWLDMPQ